MYGLSEGMDENRVKHILFLDIDGVITVEGRSNGDVPYPLSDFMPDKIALINSLYEDFPDLEIVITSDRRIDEGLPNLLEKVGLDLRNGYHKTAYRTDYRRDIEVKWYLSDEMDNGLVSFAILDDINFYHGIYTKNFVQTNPFEGVTEEDIQTIKQILKNGN